jgi:hypothetical protein
VPIQPRRVKARQSGLDHASVKRSRALQDRVLRVVASLSPPLGGCHGLAVVNVIKTTVLRVLSQRKSPARPRRGFPPEFALHKKVRHRWSWIGLSRGYTCSVTVPEAFVAWWKLVTPTSSTIWSSWLIAISPLCVEMTYSFLRKLKWASSPRHGRPSPISN